VSRDDLKRRIEKAAKPLDAARSEGEPTVAEEAATLVTGARASHYGPPVKNHRDIGIVWAVLLDLEKPIPPRTVAVMMAALKMVREGGPKAKRDNLVDACGYLLIAEMASDDATGEAE
jgi:hypothetical protein